MSPNYANLFQSSAFSYNNSKYLYSANVKKLVEAT